jgi:type I restriction enzyme R subunit
VLSSRDRLERIVDDVLMDFATRDRLASGRGNALLVSGSIYQACKIYELFARTDFRGRRAIVTSYRPGACSGTRPGPAVSCQTARRNSRFSAGRIA